MEVLQVFVLQKQVELSEAELRSVGMVSSEGILEDTLAGPYCLRSIPMNGSVCEIIEAF